MANQTATDAAHTRWWQTFEAIFGLPFLVALFLQLMMPLSLPHSVLTPAIIPVGAVLMIVGLGIIILARREFARQNQPTDPGHPTSKLVTSGVFSLSRNPLYLGGVCVVVGFALALDLPWALALLPPSLVACHSVLIAPEERYLAVKFSGQYHTYAAVVHRWIGRRHSPR